MFREKQIEIDGTNYSLKAISVRQARGVSRSRSLFAKELIVASLAAAGDESASSETIDELPYPTFLDLRAATFEVNGLPADPAAAWKVFVDHDEMTAGVKAAIDLNARLIASVAREMAEASQVSYGIPREFFVNLDELRARFRTANN